MRAYDVEKKVTEYFEDEYQRLVRLLAEPPTWLTKSEAIQNCLQRCLGVAEFAQAFNADCNYLDSLMAEQGERCCQL